MAREACQGEFLHTQHKDSFRPKQTRVRHSLCPSQRQHCLLCERIVSQIVIVMRSRVQCWIIAIKVPSTFIEIIVFILIQVKWCNSNENTTSIIIFWFQYLDSPRGHFVERKKCVPNDGAIITTNICCNSGILLINNRVFLVFSNVIRAFLPNTQRSLNSGDVNSASSLHCVLASLWITLIIRQYVVHMPWMCSWSKWIHRFQGWVLLWVSLKKPPYPSPTPPFPLQRASQRP